MTNNDNDRVLMRVLAISCTGAVALLCAFSFHLWNVYQRPAADQVQEMASRAASKTNLFTFTTNDPPVPIIIGYSEEMLYLGDTEHDGSDDLLWQAAIREAPVSIAATNTRHIPSASEIRRAMNEYRRLNPLCEICWAPHSTDGTAIQVHHRIPKHVNIYIAADHTNFWAGCRRHHWQVGHGIFNGGGFHKYNINLDETADAMRQGFTNNARFIK